MPQVESYSMTLRVSTLKKKIQTMVQWSWRFTQSPKRNALCGLSPAGAIWVETGTFNGDTAARLSEVCDVIHTIEPVPEFHVRAARRFQQQPNVICHLGTSETLFEKVVQRAIHEGAGTPEHPLCVFLDGHYSGGETHEGDCPTPIREEMATLSRFLGQITHTVIVIDDARLFGNSPGIYPSRSEVMDWAQAHRLSFSIQQDMFVFARNLLPRQYP